MATHGMNHGRAGLIGILGGTGWRSTMLPYRYLNEDVERRLGPPHSARIVLYSIDYAAIRACYADDDWARAGQLLLAEIRTLLSFSPACWMIANNTLHKPLAGIADALTDGPPIVHAVEQVAAHLVANRHRKVLLLGTRFTMEDGYFAEPLRAVGVEVTTPGERDREAVGEIQSRLDRGDTDPVFTTYFADLFARHAAQGCTAAVLACTELPLAIAQHGPPIEIVDPLRLQCRACVDLALEPSSSPA